MNENKKFKKHLKLLLKDPHIEPTIEALWEACKYLQYNLIKYLMTLPFFKENVNIDNGKALWYILGEHGILSDAKKQREKVLKLLLSYPEVSIININEEYNEDRYFNLDISFTLGYEEEIINKFKRENLNKEELERFISFYREIYGRNNEWVAGFLDNFNSHRYHTL